VATAVTTETIAYTSALLPQLTQQIYYYNCYCSTATANAATATRTAAVVTFVIIAATTALLSELP
jgi:hypothetical protein